MMKNIEKYNELSDNNEIASIIYGCIATTDLIEKRQGKITGFHPIIFLIDSLYNLNFAVYKNLDFVTRKGGARYVINDVSSYRKAKDFNVEKIKPISKLFEKYGCMTKEEIINFIYSIYLIRNNDILPEDPIIRKAIMLYQTYYKNNISINTIPKDSRVYMEYLMNKLNKGIKDNSYTSSLQKVGKTSITSQYTLNINNLKYPDVKMMIVTDGTGSLEEENAAYKFCEYMNEWFWKCNPKKENFAANLKAAIKLINKKICDDKNNKVTSASVVIITNDNLYISSIGNTRVYLIEDEKLLKINRKESLYDDIIEKNGIFPFTKEYAKKVPYDLIGKDYDLNPEVIKIDSSNITGVLISNSEIYQELSDITIENIIKNNNSEDILNQIESLVDDNISPAMAIYQKQKIKKFDRRRK